jgi:hypothetical protein
MQWQLTAGQLLLVLDADESELIVKDHLTGNEVVLPREIIGVKEKIWCLRERSFGRNAAAKVRMPIKAWMQVKQISKIMPCRGIPADARLESGIIQQMLQTAWHAAIKVGEKLPGHDQ